MNKTATLTLIAILSSGTLMAAGSSQAQPAGPGHGPGYGPGAQGTPCPRGGLGRGGWNSGSDPVAARLDRMGWRLSLSEEQKAKLEPILRQRQELRMAQRQQMRDAVAAILTPEQLAQFDHMGPGRGPRMGRGMGPGWTTQGPSVQP